MRHSPLVFVLALFAVSFGLENLLDRQDPADSQRSRGTTPCEKARSAPARQPSPEELRPLLRLLRSDLTIVRAAAEATLAGCGPAALPVLLQALADPDLRVASSAAGALGRIGPRAAVASGALAAALDRIPGPAANALAGIGRDAVCAVPALLVLHSRGTHADLVERALAEIGRGAIPFLSHALACPDRAIALSAVKLLAQARGC